MVARAERALVTSRTTSRRLGAEGPTQLRTCSGKRPLRRRQRINGRRRAVLARGLPHRRAVAVTTKKPPHAPEHAPFLRQRAASGISEVTHTSAAEICSAIQSLAVCAVGHQNHSHVRGTWRPDRSRAVGDNQNIELKARRHTVDLLPHRARITIDVDISQLQARFRLNPPTWLIKPAATLLPITAA